MTATSTRRDLWALGGVLFAATFLAGGIIGGMLAAGPFPMPGVPAAEVARYFTESRTAVLTVQSAQVLSALSLLVFVAPVAALVHRKVGERAALSRLTAGSGVLSAVLLLASALLGLAMVPVAAGGNLDLLETLRQANFLTGGTLHVASLGLFVGATSVAARRTKALPRWLSRLGIVQAALAILSLASLIFFPASLLILLGRLLGFVWCVAVGVALARGGRRGAEG